MKNHIPDISLNSVRVKMALWIIGVVIPLIGLLIFDNLYAINVIHNQVAESNKNMLSQNISQIDTNLSVIDNYLTSLAASDADLQTLDFYSDEDTRLVAVSNLSTKLSKDILAYKTLDYIFVYNPSNQDFIYAFNSSDEYDVREKVKAHILNIIDSRENIGHYLYISGWLAEEIDGQYYLIRLYKSNDSYVGAWIKVQKFLTPLKFINLGEDGASILTNSEGVIMASSIPVTDDQVDLTRGFEHYYLTGRYNQYLFVGDRSSKGDFNLIALIPNKKILEKLPYLQRIIWIIAFGSILLLSLSFILLRKIFVIPINRIISAMKRIRDGNIEVRIKPYKTSDEFKIVNETFNSMLDQIHDLRISVYEEQLSKQRAELEHLQLQVNPHFFLNSLSIIYRLAQTEKYGLIQEMSLCLLEYFRYMFRNSPMFVTLGDELKHVRNYIRIQELRFAESLTYEINAPEFLLDTPVPPLIIQNFVENTVKYAVTLDEPIHLSICIDYGNRESEQTLEIKIQDNGKGFPEDVLAKLQAGERVLDQRGVHVGIWNAQRRLQLLYKEEAGISFFNGNPSGAAVKIYLPIKYPVNFENNAAASESER